MSETKVAIALRSFLLPYVERSFEATRWFQQTCGVTSKGFTNPVLHVYFSMSAALGNEEFYILGLPMLFGQVDNEIGRRVIVFLSVMYYVGQTLKDILQLPRPWHHPQINMLERHYEKEYGLPSTHAMVSLIPLYLTLTFREREEKLNYDFQTMLISSLVWSVSMCLSRLYMGVHSGLDVVVGLLLGLGVVATLLSLGDQIDAMLTSAAATGVGAIGGAAPPAVLCGLILLLVATYPRPKVWTNAAGDTALIMSVCAGVGVATWANAAGLTGVPLNGPPAPSLWDASSSMSQSLAAVLAVASLPPPPFAVRAAIAFVLHLILMTVVLLLTRAVTKDGCYWLLTRLLPPRYELQEQPLQTAQVQQAQACGQGSKIKVAGGGVSKLGKAHGKDGVAGPGKDNATAAPDAAGGREPALLLVPPGRRYDMELPTKIVTYGAIGFNALVLVPTLVRFLGM